MKRNQLIKNPKILFLTILFGLVCFGSALTVQALVPAPDDCYVGGNTMEGHATILNLMGANHNTAIGMFSLSSNTGGNLNTAVGAGALLTNTSVENTGSGARTLLSDTIVFLLVLPWFARGLASGKSIWRALTDSQTSESKKEQCALAHSR